MEPIGPLGRPLGMDAVLGEVAEDTVGVPVTFEDFYRRSWVEVYRPLAATLGDADLAAEAVDEAMVRAYVRWRRIRTLDNPEGWIYRVAYRWAIDRIRRRWRDHRFKGRLVEAATTDEPIVEPGLGAALASLPVEQRAVVVLAAAYDWSHRRIADTLGIRPGTVKSRLHRGLERLRREMGA